MRAWHFILAACILAGLAAGLYAYSLRDAVSTDAPIPGNGNPVIGSVDADADTYDIVVRFDGELFDPKNIEVQKGTRVRFLNESDTDVWPASAVHPTHSVYPEKSESNCLGSSFDSCRGLKKGEFFDFTFDYPGEWRYHDHIRAYKTGSVTVTE